ncbi:MAG: alpha-galactosidase [Opitutaceae bacterium]|nr:alpha-galactosidase [Opitutaceae bacterium]
MIATRIALAFVLAGPGGLSAELHQDQVRLEVHRIPAAAKVQSVVRVSALERGAQSVEASVTNTSGAEISLQQLVLQFPWKLPDEKGLLLCAGGYDQGRAETRIYLPGAEPLESGSYQMARYTGGAALAGFVTWRTFNSRIKFAGGKIIVTADGEGRLLRPGETVVLEKVRLAAGSDWQDLLFTHAAEIARENRIKLNRPKTYAGWATWDYFGQGWTFKNVTDNLDQLLEIHPKADLLQIDGGWWSRRGDYTTWRESLEPGGMKKLAQLIRAKGLTAGIHLDVMRVDPESMVVRDHPEFFLKDGRGRPLTDGKRMFFDYSNPGARDYMRTTLATIRRDWGFDYFKLDFLRFGLNELIGPLVRPPHAIVPFDRGLTSVERLHLALAAFREGMGADAYLLACSAVHGPTFGHADGLRTGNDIHPNFDRLKQAAIDNAGYFHLHRQVVNNDADYLVVRAKEDQDATLARSAVKSGNLTLNEAEMWTHYVGLFGGPKLNSDNLPTLREERRALFQRAVALPTADRFVPIDFWQHARAEDDPPAVMLGEAAGVVHLAVFNWTEEPRDIRLRGMKPAELKGVTKLHGSGAAAIDGSVLTVSLRPRHSMVFRIDRASFDPLRKTLMVE